MLQKSPWNMRLLVGVALLALASARIGHTSFNYPSKLTDVQPVAFNFTKYIGQTVMVVAVRCRLRACFRWF